MQSMADSFALYLAHDVRDSVPDPVSEPVSFLVIPFLPGAVGMALARLLSLARWAACMAGASSTCWPTRCCARWRWPKRSVYRPAFAAIMLLPMSLFMGASLRL